MPGTPASLFPPARGARTTPHRIQRLWHRLRYPARPQHGDAGFTLLEVVVSLVIFAIVAASATAAIINGVSSSNVTRNRVDAANIAQQDIQQLAALPRTSVTAAPTSTTVTVGNEPYTVTRQIGTLPSGTPCPTVVATDTPHKITVHVQVNWPNDNGRSVQMDTVLAC